MFSAVWAFVAGVWKALLKRCTKQWYLVEIKTSERDAWGDRYPTHCSSLRSAKRQLVEATDTQFWIQCRIWDPDGNIVDETVANDFYDAPLDIMYMYVETDMKCAEVMAEWRARELAKIGDSECVDVRR